MNRLEIQNERLLRFAEHLNSITNHPGQIHEEVELVELDDKVRIHSKVLYDFLIIDELPAVFEEFSYDSLNGDPILEGMDPEDGCCAGIIDWFGLSPEEFCQIFDVEGYQNTEKYGGRVLTGESGPSDTAFNIIELVKRRSET